MGTFSVKDDELFYGRIVGGGCSDFDSGGRFQWRGEDRSMHALAWDCQFVSDEDDGEEDCYSICLVCRMKCAS